MMQLVAQPHATRNSRRNKNAWACTNARCCATFGRNKTPKSCVPPLPIGGDATRGRNIAQHDAQQGVPDRVNSMKEHSPW